jgi:hypothetical protein
MLSCMSAAAINNFIPRFNMADRLVCELSEYIGYKWFFFPRRYVMRKHYDEIQVTL